MGQPCFFSWTVLTNRLGLLRACELLEPDHLVVMLKAVKHLSMNATMLDVLQNVNSIEILVHILEEQTGGMHTAVRTYLLSLTDADQIYNLDILGNLEPYFPNLLQSLPTKQVSPGRSGAGRYHSPTQACHRNQLAAKTIRPSDTM